ncbi:UNVERIFIED_CONTAM: hypothetical protein FKN15_049885 [Acipenser sinensis]
MVCRSEPAHSGTVVVDPATQGPSQSGSEPSVAPGPCVTSAVGLAPEQQRLSALRLSDSVIATLQNVGASSTRSQYSYKWRVFQEWCLARDHDPTSYPMSVVFQFLQDILEEGKSPSTLKVYLAAICVPRQN